MGHATDDRGVKRRHICKFIGVIGFCKNGFGQVPSHLGDVYIDAEREFDVTDVIAAEPGVHDARYMRVVRCVLIELDPLDEG